MFGLRDLEFQMDYWSGSGLDQTVHIGDDAPTGLNRQLTFLRKILLTRLLILGQCYPSGWRLKVKEKTFFLNICVNPCLPHRYTPGLSSWQYLGKERHGVPAMYAWMYAFEFSDRLHQIFPNPNLFQTLILQGECIPSGKRILAGIGESIVRIDFWYRKMKPSVPNSIS